MALSDGVTGAPFSETSYCHMCLLPILNLKKPNLFYFSLMFVGFGEIQ